VDCDHPVVVVRRETGHPVKPAERADRHLGRQDHRRRVRAADPKLKKEK
jgi:hypothetical protein